MNYDAESGANDMYTYFDDIEGHIAQLEAEESLQDDSEHRDALNERIEQLKERKRAGDMWVDNDATASPGAWKSLATYTNTEACEQFRIWNK